MRHLQGVPWFEHKFIFVPMHLDDWFHWVSFVIDLEASKYSCYDPKQVHSSSAVFLSDHQIVKVASLSPFVSLQNDHTTTMQRLADWVQHQAAHDKAPEKGASSFEFL